VGAVQPGVWDVTDRLHEKGWIHNPVGKARSVVLTEEGVRQAEALFEKHCGRPDEPR